MVASRATLAAVASLVLGGCGSAGTPTLKQGDVVHAFESAGIPLPICQPLFHTKDIECADSALMHLAPDAKLVDVQVLPNAKLAEEVVRIGGNMQDGKGHTYPPFARVANVVVTLVVHPTASERRRVERAVGLLRSRLGRRR